ncbi:hypothetical protein [Microlunatus speluncae]|uniref:hypothetical protein n=1 Tax=Microlunatus speluncae TaxID=2594267 RepID=UPI00126682F7|nr:hypothetical protein [Microlunatus speluncae]
MSEPSSTPGPPQRGRIGSRVLLVHGIVVLAFLILYVIATALHTGPDANIGAGLVGLVLLVLGLPWTIPFLAGATEPTGGLGLLLRLGPAVLNLALHALLRLALRRRPR